MTRKLVYLILGVSLLVALTGSALPDEEKQEAVIPPPLNPILSVSTSPANGDSNPYGVAFAPDGFPAGGPLSPGDVLVSNFNSNSGLQGTGTTIVQIKQSGGPGVLFFQGQAPLGLTTALGVLKGGFVIVGNVPTTDGMFDTIQQGSLLIIDKKGNLVTTVSDNTLLNGPWDLTINDHGDWAQVFVSNVLSGTVTRINLRIKNGKLTIESLTQIASGYGVAPNQAAVVVGPTGLAYDAWRDVLYVASTDDNEIFAVRGAGSTAEDRGTGEVIYQDDTHLHGPLALALAPNGDLITANGDAVNEDPNQLSEIVEFTPNGHFVAQFQIDPVAGSAFGLAVNCTHKGIVFAAVDDTPGVLDVWLEPAK
jgi:hypothetical protein